MGMLKEHGASHGTQTTTGSGSIATSSVTSIYGQAETEVLGGGLKSSSTALYQSVMILVSFLRTSNSNLCRSSQPCWTDLSHTWR